MGAPVGQGPPVIGMPYSWRLGSWWLQVKFLTYLHTDFGGLVFLASFK